MELMRGTKITDFSELEAKPISRPRVAQILTRAYFRQVLENGLLHADPHPGNILIRPGPVIVLLDFGMVGEIRPHTRDNIRRVFMGGVVSHDYDDVLAGLEAMGSFGPDADQQGAPPGSGMADRDLLRDVVWRAADGRSARRPGTGSGCTLALESFRICGQLCISGAGTRDSHWPCDRARPEFQFFVVAEPYTRRLIHTEPGWRGVMNTAVREARSIHQTGLLYAISGPWAFEGFSRGEYDFRSVEAIERSVTRPEAAMRRLLYALLVLTFVLAGVMVFHALFNSRPLRLFCIADFSGGHLLSHEETAPSLDLSVDYNRCRERLRRNA